MRIATWTSTAVVAFGVSACADAPWLGPGPDMNATRAAILLGGIGTGSMPAAAQIGVSTPLPASRGGASDGMLDTEATLGDDDGLDDDDALGNSATDLGYDGFGADEEGLLDAERGLADDNDGLLD